MTNWDFPCSDPIDANISFASGSVTVTAAPTDAVTVVISGDDDKFISEVTVDFADRHLVLSEPPRRGLSWRGRDLRITISMPPGSRLSVQVASAEVRCRGEYGAVDIRTASGGVDVDVVRGRAEVSTASGDVRITEAGEVNAQTASGELRVGHATGDVTGKTASGSLSVGAADASVTGRTASGSISLGSVARGRADLTSVSGDVEVNVVQGTGVFLDLSSLSGRVTTDLAASEPEGEADLRLRCQTVSGSVQVSRAAS
jgi:putative adhesin